MSFKESETLAILFEEGFEGFEKLRTPGDPNYFMEFISHEADASCHGHRALEAFEDGFKLAQTAQFSNFADDPVYVQREGDYAWFFVGTEAGICQRIKKLIKKALKE